MWLWGARPPPLLKNSFTVVRADDDYWLTLTISGTGAVAADASGAAGVAAATGAAGAAVTAGISAYMGRMKWKVLPLPNSLSAQIRPPISVSS